MSKPSRIRQRSKNTKINKEYINAIRTHSTCKICGASGLKRPLTFHHVDPKQKSFDITQKLNHSPNRIQRELEKCEILCYHCHQWYENRYGKNVSPYKKRIKIKLSYGEKFVKERRGFE